MPRPSKTPWVSSMVTGAVWPYSEMFERGDQMIAVWRSARIAPSTAVRPTPWMNAPLLPVTSTPSAELRHKNSLRASASMPSETWGDQASSRSTSRPGRSG